MTTVGPRGRFTVKDKIGEGAFGVIFSGTDSVTQDPVAIKCEPRGTGCPLLKAEAALYSALGENPGLPKVHWFGDAADTGDDFSALVTDLLGANLEELYTYCGRKFSEVTVLALGRAVLGLLEAVHAKGYVHGDVKPENFLMPFCPVSQPGQSVHVIDFGLSTRYRSAETGAHIPKAPAPFQGSPRFASVQALSGMAQSRRDDLESLGYMLVYFLRPKVPS